MSTKKKSDERQEPLRPCRFAQNPPGTCRRAQGHDERMDNISHLQMLFIIETHEVGTARAGLKCPREELHRQQCPIPWPQPPLGAEHRQHRHGHSSLRKAVFVVTHHNTTARLLMHQANQLQSNRAGMQLVSKTGNTRSCCTDPAARPPTGLNPVISEMRILLMAAT
jgi:hypothetical protein